MILCTITLRILHLCLLVLTTTLLWCIIYTLAEILIFNLSMEKVKLICNNSTFVGAMWPPKFAEAPLDREPIASQMEDLWVRLLPQPAVVHLVPDSLDSVCSVGTKSTSTNM